MNKKDLRIVFMGTPDFAVANLKTLLDAEYNVVGVITAPDRPSGRGQKINESAVKKYAKSKDLIILQPTNLKNEDFLKKLKSLNANLQIVVAFRMLPQAVWAMPEYGTFNLHASILPNYRGAAPIHWAIKNGETKTGVTTFFIDDKIDTGAIILQDELQIGIDETVGQLHDRLMNLGSKLVVDTVRRIENGNVQTTIQPKTENFKTAYKLNKENCKIDWNKNVESIYNKIRGLNPFPSAWCYLQNGDEKLRVKIYDVKMIYEDNNEEPGSISQMKDELKVSVKGGYILIQELQIPGKRKMDIKSLLNGYDINENAKML
ncbi:MAG: methionyl-tRNA formyltransferase [Bacteroidota bacterium]